MKDPVYKVGRVRKATSGRPKATHYLPYALAKKYMRDNASHITTRKKYRVWRRSVRNDFLPIFPERVYVEWDSWNDFLGNSNSFEGVWREKSAKKKRYRSFWEAVRYVQRIAKENGLTTKEEWLEWHDKGECPEDIPRRPSYIYPEWIGTGWTTWLGKNIEVIANNVQENIGVMSVMGIPGQPANVIQIIYERDGFAVLKSKYDARVMGKVYRIYKWDNSKHQYLNLALERFTFKRENINQFLVPNMFALLEDLDYHLEWYKQ